MTVLDECVHVGEHVVGAGDVAVSEYVDSVDVGRINTGGIKPACGK
jgi:hypothetical protein